MRSANREVRCNGHIAVCSVQSLGQLQLQLLLHGTDSKCRVMSVQELQFIRIIMAIFMFVNTSNIYSLCNYLILCVLDRASSR